MLCFSLGLKTNSRIQMADKPKKKKGVKTPTIAFEISNSPELKAPKLLNILGVM